jgi:hypothetical protein
MLDPFNADAKILGHIRICRPTSCPTFRLTLEGTSSRRSRLVESSIAEPQRLSDIAIQCNDGLRFYLP